MVRPVSPDWTVGTGDLYGKPAAWINVAAPGRGTGALAELATVLRYVTVETLDAACVSAPVTRDALGPDGLVHDATVRAALTTALHAVLNHLAARARDTDSPDPGGETAVRCHRSLIARASRVRDCPILQVTTPWPDSHNPVALRAISSLRSRLVLASAKECPIRPIRHRPPMTSSPAVPSVPVRAGGRTRREV
ncbi:hypothetical protein [Frankia sp. AgKG'84/4]|uniref:hypothetical protein n=1 Tax=Frankia sp. AgKG'84/4 TaxID=573490 RepID=UPI00202AACFE|nr:hypothetical protein [Frankia sp. AgKG'84/4]MCL9795197.1 hypothetical protein [Frankia sp. AgKG'84/4]